MVKFWVWFRNGLLGQKDLLILVEAHRVGVEAWNSFFERGVNVMGQGFSIKPQSSVIFQSYYPSLTATLNGLEMEIFGIGIPIV